MALSAQAACAGLDRSIERTMDRQARDAIESQYAVVDDARLAGLVQRIGQAVADKSPRKGVNYQFKVLDTPEVNAVALPAGHVYVTTGLLEFIDCSDELANVLAHEVVHVAEKHSLGQFKREFWKDVLFGLLRLPPTTAQVVGLAAGLQGLRYSRKDEAAADRIGAHIAYAAGFDPRYMKKFMDKLAKKEHVSTIASYLSTHPSPERRSVRLEELPELNLKRTETLTAIASAYTSRHMLNMAALRLRQAAAAAPNDPKVRRLLAETYYRLGDNEAAAREAEILSRLAPGEKVNQPPAAEPCTEPIPADLPERTKAGKSRLEQAVAAITPAQELKRAAKELESSEKEISKRRDSLAGDISARSSRASGASLESLRRASAVLRQVRDSLSAVDIVRRGLESETDDATSLGRTLSNSLDSTRDPCGQVRLIRSAEQFATEMAGAGSTRDQAVQAARGVIEAARTALQHLDQAVLYAAPSPGFGPSLATTTGANELEAAERDSARAAQSAATAKELQDKLNSGRTAVRINIETAAASPPEMGHFESLVADLLALPVQDVASARQRHGGLGTALVALVKEMPAQQPTGAKPAPAKRGKADAAALLVGVVANTVHTEAAAAREVVSGVAQQSVLP